MNIRDTKELKQFAGERLEMARDPKRIVLIYAGITVAVAAALTVGNYMTGLEMSRSGGLSNMSKRSVLSALQSMMPLVQSILLMFLDVGYIAAMLRIARGQYASPNTLRLGMDRVGVLLRCAIIRGLLYSAVLFASVYFGIMIFMLTPLSEPAVEVLAPAISETSLLDQTLVLDDAMYARFSQAVIPAYLICGVLYAVLAVPMVYSYRMVNYIIIDHPGMGALQALGESKKMMRRNRVALFKLDVSLWWYYLAVGLATVVCYGDVILAMLGISLPVQEDVAYFIFFGAYLAILFVVYYFLRNRVEVTYGLAYDAVKPEEKKDNSVVLGNIFQM